jgi:hypothetical protein
LLFGGINAQFYVVVLGFGAVYTGRQMSKFRGNMLSPSSGLKMETALSLNRWDLHASLYGAKTQKNNVTAVKTSNLT